MILQINNSKIVVDLDALNAVLDPLHGDIYFVTSESSTYSFYNTGKNEDDGAWVKDSSAIVYEKADSLEVGFTDVTAIYPNVIGSLVDEIKSVYRQYSIDGNAYFDDVRASLVIDYKTGDKTMSEIFEIETFLEPVTTKLKAGDWMTANYVLSTITATGAATQEFKDEIALYISNYIANNY